MSQAVPHGYDRPVRAFIEAKVSEDGEIASLRDDLYTEIDASSKYRKSEPHLTILPPFTIDKSHAHRVNQLLEESGLIGRDIPVRGVSVWPSVQNPRVVLLDTPIDIEKERQTLMQKLRDLGAVEMNQPVYPHITLFKTDNGYEIPSPMKGRIQRAVWDNREKWETEIKYVDFTIVAQSTSDD